MKSVRLTLSFTLFVLASSLVFGEARCPGNVTPVRYHPLAHSQMSVPVVMDGSGPFEFIVDTGSQMTIIEPSLAAALHLQAQGRVGLTSAVERTIVPVVMPDSVAVGEHSVHVPMVAVESLSEFQVLSRRLRGILGEDFLAHFDLLIDRRQQILCMDGTGQMQRAVLGEHIPLVQVARRGDTQFPKPLLISVRLLRRNSEDAIFRLDSGANLPVLYEGRLRRALWPQRDQALRGRVANQAAQYTPLWPPQDLRIGTFLLREIAFLSPVTTSRLIALQGEDGVIPTSLFQRIFISHTGRFVILEPGDAALPSPL